MGVDIFNHTHQGLMVASGSGWDFAQIISWVLQAGGLWGVLAAVIAGFVFAHWPRFLGPVPSGAERVVIYLSIPFQIVSVVYVSAVLMGHDVWGWSNWFDFLQVGFVAITGQLLSTIFGITGNYITLQQLITFLKSGDPAEVIAALKQVLQDLLAAEQGGGGGGGGGQPPQQGGQSGGGSGLTIVKQ